LGEVWQRTEEEVPLKESSQRLYSSPNLWMSKEFPKVVGGPSTVIAASAKDDEV